MGVGAATLAQLRATLGPSAAHIPLRVDEFGWASWQDDAADEARSQAGALGAAWRVAAWAYQIAQGVDDVFHWASYFDTALATDGGVASSNHTLVTGTGCAWAPRARAAATD